MALVNGHNGNRATRNRREEDVPAANNEDNDGEAPVYIGDENDDGPMINGFINGVVNDVVNDVVHEINEEAAMEGNEDEEEESGGSGDNEQNGDNTDNVADENEGDADVDNDQNVENVQIDNDAEVVENASDEGETATGNVSEEVDVAMGNASDDSEPVPRRAILVTGGAGYVGSHTIMNLLERGEHDDLDIIVVDNLSNSYMEEGEQKPAVLKIIEEMTHKQVQFFKIDIRDKEDLNSLFNENNIEFVYHFAALKAVGQSVVKPLEYHRANLTATITLLEVMRDHGVNKLIYSSSCTVYGEPAYLPLDEEHPTGRNLTSPYGKTKYFCEEIMKDVCASDPKWSVISLRYFNPVGAHRSGKIGEDPEGIPNNLMPYISQVAVGRLNRLLVYGDDYDTIDGTGVRDFIHVEDLADGHVCALKLFSSPTFEGGFTPINLGTGTGYSVMQLITMFERVCGRKIPTSVVGRREGDIGTNYAEVNLAKKLLGWYAVRTLYTICDDTWRWQSANPYGFRKTNPDDED